MPHQRAIIGDPKETKIRELAKVCFTGGVLGKTNTEQFGDRFLEFGF